MHTQHLLSTFESSLTPSATSFERTRRAAEPLAYLAGMDTNRRHLAAVTDRPADSLEPVISLSELAARLGVSVQTIYDLRSQGRGPRGFRVGRELRFRVGEIDAWLARMEQGDAQRHPTGGR